MRYPILFVALALTALTGCSSQKTQRKAPPRLERAPDYNLGFEKFGADGSPDRWVAIVGDERRGSLSYKIRADSNSIHGGHWSLHIDAGDNDGYCIVKQTSGIVEVLRGKLVRYSGWVRMSGAVRTAGVALRAIAKHDSLLVAPVESATNAEGITDWQRLSLTSEIDSSAVDLEFGVYMQGSGEAWFDDLSIDTNGVAYAK